ncbi:MAG: PIN domain-containing protein [Phycisphaerales bacterium]|jgi:predicted nucleic acid-binding protein|nr:PIN domain-containing protein [Phycisphaerales bacterium]
MGSIDTITGSTVYLDTNVLIYAVESIPEFVGRVRDIFDRIDRGELQGVTSELSLAEALIMPLRKGRDLIRNEFELLLDPSGPLMVKPITRQVLVKAAEIRAKYSSMKLPDAIHAATAVLNGCTSFITNDSRFAVVDTLPVVLLSQLPG